MFVVLTLFGCWLGWNANIVQQRKAMREQARQENARSQPFGIKFIEEIQGIDQPTMFAREFYDKVKSVSTQPSASQELSILRKWMGDKPANQIFLRDHSEHDLVRNLFPEAAVFVLPESGLLVPNLD